MYLIKNFDSTDNNLMPCFKEFSSELYCNDRFWMGKEESYPDKAKYFLVYKENKIIGRACGIINSGIFYQNQKTCLIGFYECGNDLNASKVLFKAVEDYFKKIDFEYLIGPINGSTWRGYRITEPNDDPPFFLDNYHKSWYLDQFKSNGFAPIAKYLSTKTDNLARSYKRLEKFEKIYAEKGVKIRNIDLDEFLKEIRKIYDISIKSFKDNFLYTPISFDEFAGFYGKIRKIINPEFILIAEDSMNEPLGFIFAINNIFSKDKKSLVIKTVAVVPGGKGRGVGSLLFEKIYKAAFDNGYQEIFHALMHENNQSTQILSKGSSIYHTYLLFGKKL